MTFKRLILSLLGLCLCTSITLASSLDTTRVVSEVKIEGLLHVDRGALPKVEELHSRVGRKIINKHLKRDLNKLYLEGYFSSVTARTVQDDNQVILIFDVVENPKINTISFKNVHSIPKRKLKSLMRNKKGSALNIRWLEQDKKKIETYYREKGYDFFNITKIQFTDDHNLEIIVNEGIIHGIDVEGLTLIQPYVISRNMLSQPGTVFNSEKIRKDRERLLRLGYFSDVSSPKFNSNKDDKIDIQFTVQEKKANQVSTGFEQEEEQFVTFLQFVTNHNLLHSDVISAKVQAGNTNFAEELDISSYGLKYSQPWFLNRYSFAMSVNFWQKLQQEVATSEQTSSEKTIQDTTRIGGDLLLTHPIQLDKLSVSTRFKNEIIQPRNNSAFDKYKIQSISGIINYRSTNSFFNPKKGSYMNFEYEKGGDIFVTRLNSVNFTRATLEGAKFFGLNDKTVLAVRSSLGMFSTQNESDTFETEDFIIGGAYSLRGYDESTYPFSGKRKVLYNIEYRYDFHPKMQSIFFIDLGKTFDNDQSWSLFKNLNKGQGIGIRFFTPVGPIRIDLANAEKDFYIHFGLGQLF